MTTEEKRVAIAKLCPESVEWHDGIAYWKGSWSALGEGNEYLATFDPFNDLNACHEMEKTLDGFYEKDWAKTMYGHYIGNLGSLCGSTHRIESAPSDCRAEAFGVTLGLW